MLDKQSKIEYTIYRNLFFNDCTDEEIVQWHTDQLNMFANYEGMQCRDLTNKDKYGNNIHCAFIHNTLVDGTPTIFFRPLYSDCTMIFQCPPTRENIVRVLTKCDLIGNKKQERNSVV